MCIYTFIKYLNHDQRNVNVNEGHSPVVYDNYVAAVRDRRQATLTSKQHNI